MATVRRAPRAPTFGTQRPRLTGTLHLGERAASLAPRLPRAPRAPQTTTTTSRWEPPASILGGGGGGGGDLGQANQLANSLLAPQTAAANAAYQQQLQSGLAGIQSLTQAIIGQIGPMDQRIAGIYGEARANQGALDNALQASTLNAGQQQAEGLGSKLAAIQSPGAAPLAAGQAAIGAGAGNAAFGIGSAELSRLIGNEASARAYVAKQPGIIGQTGIVQAGQLTQKLATELQAELAKVESQRPGLVMDTLNRLSTARTQKQQQAALAEYRKASLGLQQQRINAQGAQAAERSAQGWARIGQAAKNEQVRQLESDRNYALAVQRVGISERSLQLRAATAQAKLEGGGFTVSQLTQLKKRAGKIATDAVNGKASGVSGWLVKDSSGDLSLVPVGTTQAVLKQNGLSLVTDSNGAPKTQKSSTTHHLTYQQAMKLGLSQGIPLTVMQDALNAYWTKPGAGKQWEYGPDGKLLPGAGRPALSYQQRQARGIGSPPFAGSTAGFNTAAKVIETAKQFVGTPYRYGGASPKTGFDCSGLLTYAFGQQGIKLPHNAAQQFHMGTPVPPNQLQPGDAVFFITDGTPTNPGHVGIYLGNGQVLTSPHTGAVVKIDELAAHNGYVGARRYV